MSTTPRILMVGSRPGALHAASRLGITVVLIEDKPVSDTIARRIAGHIQAPVEGAIEETCSSVAAAWTGSPPSGIVAVGERGVLLAAALREAFDLPGTRPETATVVRDKPSMKARIRAAGIACTDWADVIETSAKELIRALGLPLVLKRRDGSGTSGLTVSRTLEEAQANLAAIDPAERGGWMAERFVSGTEMSLESFVEDGEVRFTNPTEYYVPAFANIAPAVLSEERHAELLDMNRHAIRTLGVQRGMTHLEVYWTDAGLLFGEIAVRPPGGRIMRLIRRAYDIDPWEMVLRLEIGEALPELPERARRAAGVWMLHPGPGRVVSVRGLAAARRVRGVRKLVCRIRAGREVATRRGTGSDVGWFEVGGPSRDKVAERMEAAHGAIRIEMAQA